MTTDLRRIRGARGEDLAARHLSAHGYEVLERNFRTRHGELDLIAADDRCIVFCEVKTRASAGRAGPARGLDAIGAAKRRKLRSMARQWLYARPAGSARPSRPQLRFDAIEVTLTAGGALVALEHVTDAF
jgi:putative endonuclease